MHAVSHYIKMNRLKGLSALVTGSNSGIGMGIAKGLAIEGARVVVNYVVDDEAADRVVNEINESGGKTIAIKADISEENQVIEMFEKMYDELGTIDILVNNTGIQRDSYVHENQQKNLFEGA